MNDNYTMNLHNIPTYSRTLANDIITILGQSSGTSDLRERFEVGVQCCPVLQSFSAAPRLASSLLLAESRCQPKIEPLETGLIR